MENIIVLAIVVVAVGLAIGYIVKAKRNGKKCIGCPDGGNCSSGCGCGCSNDTE